MTDEMWYLIEQQAKQLTELSARINRSDEVAKQYAALRIEELERDLEECQKAKNVLLEALEGAKWVMDSYVRNPSIPECREVVEALRKAGGEE